MSNAQELYKHQTVVVFYGSRVIWSDNAAASPREASRFRPWLTPLPPELLDAMSFASPADKPEGDWQGALLVEVVGIKNGRSAFHLAFLHIHKGIDFCGAYIADGLCNEFANDSNVPREVTLYQLGEAQRAAGLALRGII